MYNKFFGLAEAPFNITPDSRFLFLSQRHREALGALVYGVRERKGFILLTGEIGAGKTTICRALIHELRADDVRLAVILNPGLSELELLKAINDEFQIPSFYDTKKGLVDALNNFLIKEHQAGHNVVLIIDEAQNLDPGLLEQIRMLSNLETEDAKLIQIVLIGQPELNDTLQLTQLEQLNQRITVRYHITPLSAEEMLAYVKHRLFVARAKVDVEITEAAARLAHQYTRGIPRKVNVLFDRALLACYVDGSYTIDEKIMQKAILEVSGPQRQSQAPGPEKVPLGRRAGRALVGPFARRFAMASAGLLIALGVVSAAVSFGIRYANIRAEEQQLAESGARPTTLEPEAEPGTQANAMMGSRLGAAGDDRTTEPAPAPTPPPDWEALRQRNPNWKWEKDAPLCRVNNPRFNLRAAQFSILKTWGLVVDLSAAAKMGDELLTQGEFANGEERIAEVSIPGDYFEALRFNVPVIVRIKDPGEDVSPYVVMLQAAGEAVTVGDPIWGIKKFKAKDFIKRWGGATAILRDKFKLSTIRRGERSERVRTLQRFLQDFLRQDSGRRSAGSGGKSVAEAALKDFEVTGIFDVKTGQAIGQFQEYYNLKRTEQLDDLTVLLLNARMMRGGPCLNPALDSR